MSASRVLVVRVSAMGDVVQALGAVRALAAARPALELHWVVQRPYAPLFAGLPFLRGVVVHDRHPAVRGYVGTGQRLRELAPDTALDLQGNWKSAGLARLSGARTRIGAVGALRREPQSHVLLNRLVGRPGDSSHPAAIALQVVRALAPDATVDDSTPLLVATSHEVERETRALTALGVDPARPFRVLILAVARDPRAWRIAAMRREERASPLPCVWLAGPAEADLDAPADAKLLRHGRGELRRLVALGALVRRAGGDVLGPDVGSLHVLAATGARTHGLFGPHDPARTGPVMARAHVATDGPACRPCGSRVCHHPDGPVCMDFTLAESRAVGEDRRGDR